MSVVADAGPLHYLILIDAVDALRSLYGPVLVCESVVRELKASAAPYVVRSWIERPPEWCEPLPDPPLDAASEFLDAGERAAIELALSSGADRLLIDDWEGRAEAIRLHLAVTGTLGILAEAHRHNPLDFETVLMRLGQPISTSRLVFWIACARVSPKTNACGDLLAAVLGLALIWRLNSAKMGCGACPF